MPTNPNGTNQYVLDPRQNSVGNFILNQAQITSETYQSAMKAGYEERLRRANNYRMV